MKRHMKVNTDKNYVWQWGVAVIVLGILGAVCLGIAGDSEVSGLTFQESTDVEFTINPTISVEITGGNLVIDELAPGSSADSNVITVGVDTNAGWGYYLAATVMSSTDLVKANSSYKFSSLSANAASLAAFPNSNSWGYSYSTDGGTTWVSGNAGATATGYNGLPLDGGDDGATGVKLMNSNTTAASGSVKFKIGAKALKEQAAGDYTGTIKFYAVTNPES